MSDPWVQDKLRSGAFHLHKLPGQQNVADVLPKYVDTATLFRLMPLMGLKEEEGRATSAPNLQN